MFLLETRINHRCHHRDRRRSCRQNAFEPPVSTARIRLWKMYCESFGFRDVESYSMKNTTPFNMRPETTPSNQIIKAKHKRNGSASHNPPRYQPTGLIFERLQFKPRSTSPRKRALRCIQGRSSGKFSKYSNLIRQKRQRQCWLRFLFGYSRICIWGIGALGENLQ